MESKSYDGTVENSEKKNLSVATGRAPIPVKTPAWAAVIMPISLYSILRWLLYRHGFNDC
jgi:hypothetical protein